MLTHRNYKTRKSAGIVIGVVVVLAIVILIQNRNLSISRVYPLGFSIYTTQSNLLPLFENIYSEATSNSLLIDDNYNQPPRVYMAYWNHPQEFGRMILANNYSTLTSNEFSIYINNVKFAKAYNFTSYDYIGYDAEDWNLTPINEQTNQVTYVQMACDYVHNAGYRFAYSPEVDVPEWGDFSQVNWTCVDLLDLQEQFMSGNTTDLVKNVTQLLAVSKAKNQNMKVFVQITMTDTPQSTLSNDIVSLSQLNGLNGIIIEDECSTSACNSTLNLLINQIKNTSTRIAAK